MFRLSAIRSIHLVAVIFLLTGVANAYTRAYITNETGQAAYGLHVKLDHSAKPNTAGSGLLTAAFVDAKLGFDGLTLDFSHPLNSLGILADETVSIGWQDLDPNASGLIVSYWWTDADGKLIGSIHYGPPPGSGNSNTGGSPSGDNPAPLVYGNTDSDGDATTGDGAVGPGGPGFSGNGLSGGSGNPADAGNPDDGGNPPSGGNSPDGGNWAGGGHPAGGGTDPQTAATPEPGGLIMVLGGLAAMGVVRWNRRRRPAG